VTDNTEEYTILWNAPKIEKPEFRLYYDDLGAILFYTCDKITDNENYIIVDAMVFAEARYDIRVIDGRIIKNSSIATIVKLTPSNSGFLCAAEDLSIIVKDTDDIEKKYWKLTVYEF